MRSKNLYPLLCNLPPVMTGEVKVGMVGKIHQGILIGKSLISNMQGIILRQFICYGKIHISGKTLIHIFGKYRKTNAIFPFFFSLKKSSSIIFRTGMAITMLLIV